MTAWGVLCGLLMLERAKQYCGSAKKQEAMTADTSRKVLLALAACAASDAAFVGPPGRAPTGLGRRCHRAHSVMSAPQPLNSSSIDDDPFATLPESMTIPNKLPSFGLSKRESTRLSCMFRRDEPLLQEVLGLQVLLGMIGSNVMGFVGIVLGCFQFAPCLSMIPGRVGEVFRITGWHIFSALLKFFEVADRMWRSTASYRLRRVACTGSGF